MKNLAFTKSADTTVYQNKQGTKKTTYTEH